jgi:endonuclease YncB( thermonuclease family)
LRLAACVLALLLGFPVVSSSADPLAPPEAAALTTRLLDGKVWLVHAVIVRVIDGDTVVVNMDLGWHTWRHEEHVRLNGIDAPERTEPERWAAAKAFRTAAARGDRGSAGLREVGEVRSDPWPHPASRRSGCQPGGSQRGPGQAVHGRATDAMTRGAGAGG